MRYQINKENYHRFDIQHLGKLFPRSYFIPFSTKELADSATINDRRYCSDKVTVLSGQWDFKFYPNPAELPDVLHTETISFDTLDVPSCWQMRGYDRPFYVNTRYQFPFKPPEIPKEEPVGTIFSMAGSDYGLGPRWIRPKEAYNFVGVYRKIIRLEDRKTRVISFLGVSSCLDLYVNGQFVGYSEGSHNTAEFDLTSYLQKGDNELLAVVRRWCTGSYLECQDMFRHNGIFRDVLLYEMESVDFWDVDFSARKTGDGYRADISAVLTTPGEVKVTLSGYGICREKRVQGKEISLSFENLKVLEWTAETPRLYDLYLELPGSCVKLRVGFRDLHIQKDLFLLNGRKVKFKGVNHHDTHPRNGYTLKPREMEWDVRLCKQYNMNMVRTSHYPPDPIFLDWCDELGLYVVDEADLETHGVFTQQVKMTYNTLSHDSRWEDRYLERVQHLYERDKLHPGVVMWSLGNEAGGYRNTDAMYRWLKERTNTPVHYESAIHSPRIAYDVGSEMYPTLEMVEKVGLKKRKERPLNDRPYFLCEYAHAMGVGPGAVEKYWELIYRYDSLAGGCVWEMVDHAVQQENGEYTYGGDHGEYEHDKNFCVDGLFYPNRKPSTGAKVIRHVYRPIRIRHLDGCRYEIFNTNAFTGSDVYEMRFLYPDGKTMGLCLSIPPLTKRVVRIPNCPPSATWVNVAVIDKRTGQEVSREQLIFRIPVLREVKADRLLPQWVELKDGMLRFVKNGKYLSIGAPYTVLFRAPTDNDFDFSNKSSIGDFTRQKEELIGISVQNGVLHMNYKILCPKHEFLCTDTYEGCAEGVLVTSRLKCVKGKGNLPRFGKAFFLGKEFDEVTYVGRNGESYCDMKEHARIERVCSQVLQMTEPNIRPQESGNRCDCTELTMSDGSTVFTIRAVDKPFELGVKPYSDRELLSMKHRSDEKRTGTYVTVSAFQMGIGTGSCGPKTLPEYCFDVRKEYVLRFVIS